MRAHPTCRRRQRGAADSDRGAERADGGAHGPTDLRVAAERRVPFGEDLPDLVVGEPLARDGRVNGVERLRQQVFVAELLAHHLQVGQFVEEHQVHAEVPDVQREEYPVWKVRGMGVEAVLRRGPEHGDRIPLPYIAAQRRSPPRGESIDSLLVFQIFVNSLLLSF